MNGFASYFDPLTKYCLTTQALIQHSLQNTNCHNLPCHHFRLSDNILYEGGWPGVQVLQIASVNTLVQLVFTHYIGPYFYKWLARLTLLPQVKHSKNQEVRNMWSSTFLQLNCLMNIFFKRDNSIVWSCEMYCILNAHSCTGCAHKGKNPKQSPILRIT